VQRSIARYAGGAVRRTPHRVAMATASPPADDASETGVSSSGSLGGRVRSVLDDVQHASREDRLLDLDAIEQKLGQPWEIGTLVDQGRRRVTDVLHWRLLEAAVARSVRAHVCDVAATVRRLPGLHASQTSEHVGHALAQVRDALVDALCRALLVRGGGPARLLDAVAHVRARYCAAHVALVRRTLDEQIAGLRALSALAAAQPLGDDLLQEHLPRVAALVGNPPASVERELERSGARLADLSGVLTAARDGLVVAARIRMRRCQRRPGAQRNVFDQHIDRRFELAARGLERGPDRHGWKVREHALEHCGV